MQAALGLEQSVYGIAGMITAAAVVFFAYTGFEALANLGEETLNPKKDLRVGILGALAVCAVLYIGVSIVLTGMIPFTDIDTGAPLADAFDKVGQHWVGALISLGAVTGLTSVMMVELVTIGRIGFAMGRDGLLPKKLGTAHPKWGTPHRMTIGGAVLIAVLAAFIPISELADMVSIGALSAMIIVAVAVPVLRHAAARPGPAVHRAVLAGDPDRRGGGVLLPDAEPERADVDPVRGLAGARAGHLLHLRPPPLPLRARERRQRQSHEDGVRPAARTASRATAARSASTTTSTPSPASAAVSHSSGWSWIPLSPKEA